MGSIQTTAPLKNKQDDQHRKKQGDIPAMHSIHHAVIIPAEVWLEVLLYGPGQGVQYRDGHLAVVLLGIGTRRITLEHFDSECQVRSFIGRYRQSLNRTDAIGQVTGNEQEQQYDMVVF